MTTRGKKYIDVSTKVDSRKEYTVDEAMELVAQAHYAKFDETVDIAVNLGIDPRHANQQIRSALVLPHGLGKKMTVLVFATDDKAVEAKDAGADYVGLDDIVEKISKENWLDFDVAIATPDVMSKVGRLGKVLGPRGLMPSPKVGTVTSDVANMVKESKAGRVEIRNDKSGVIHAPVGKVSFGKENLKENFLAFMGFLIKEKPVASKGIFLKRVSVSATMGPGIGVSVPDIRNELKSMGIAA
ncbi:MAG: 50S ribosomal protein L1 [Candidatus Dadabacteria bacterium]|nr:50S ribosomal protein L1 [Candidatus Dadabacteria bacterium]MDE0159805.1 50S ribosomal protein L1 [Candidatus Dadabacteria bacterium]MDE0477538.1 50S ribosomal protein L1 [Candidatus Dadabacteria bacterium]MDE0520252.1 50S ribosomal protein L1 [Candidatus Dadabacteria bacterium]MDE0663710.1 50S ribosomal protein L1 [Candidatus Dadabacteria bacterium]